MALKVLRPGNSKSGYKVKIPVFRVPSDTEYNDFAADPTGLNSPKKQDPKTRATLKFYASLRHPDDEVDMDYIPSK